MRVLEVKRRSEDQWEVFDLVDGSAAAEINDFKAHNPSFECVRVRQVQGHEELRILQELGLSN